MHTNEALDPLWKLGVVAGKFGMVLVAFWNSL